MVLRAHAHGGFRRGRVSRADRRHAALVDNIIGIVADGRRVAEGLAGVHLIMLVFLLVQDEGGSVFRGNARQGDGAVRGDVGDDDVRAADGRRGGAARDGSAEVRQPARVIGQGVVELAVVAAGDHIAVEHVVHQEAVPVLAVLVVVPRARAGADGLLVGSVAVLQLGVVDGDGYIFGNTRAGLDRLIGGRGRRGAGGGEVDDAGAFAADDPRAVFGGIDLIGDVDRTVDVHLRVLQVVRRAHRRGAVRGGVTGDDQFFIRGAAVAAPVVRVVEIDGSVGAERRAFVDRQLGAGQEGDAVGLAGRDGGRAGLNDDVHVVEGQNVFTRIHRDRADQRQAGDLDGQVVHLHIAVRGDLELVHVRVVALGDIVAARARQLEHTVRADEFERGAGIAA